MKRNRAFRRYQKNRYIKRAFYKLKHWYFRNEMVDEKMLSFAKRMADNFTVCSCESCRNPRHSSWSNKECKLTIQERKIA